MDQETFRNLLIDASKRAVEHLDSGVIGHLMLTQTYRRRPKIREPEMRHAFAQVAEEQGRHHYGIEVPTVLKYRFTQGDGGKTHARHDLVFFAEPRCEAKRQVLVELKEGRFAADSDNMPIRKDFVKLLQEPDAEGRAFVHILPTADVGTLRAVVAAYSKAYEQAPAELKTGAPSYKWFMLFFLLAVSDPKKSPIDESLLYAFALEDLGTALKNVTNNAPPFPEPPTLLRLRP